MYPHIQMYVPDWFLTNCIKQLPRIELRCPLTSNKRHSQFHLKSRGPSFWNYTSSAIKSCTCICPIIIYETIHKSSCLYHGLCSGFLCCFFLFIVVVSLHLYLGCILYLLFFKYIYNRMFRSAWREAWLKPLWVSCLYTAHSFVF